MDSSSTSSGEDRNDTLSGLPTLAMHNVPALHAEAQTAALNAQTTFRTVSNENMASKELVEKTVKEEEERSLKVKEADSTGKNNSSQSFSKEHEEEETQGKLFEYDEGIEEENAEESGDDDDQSSKKKMKKPKIVEKSPTGRYVRFNDLLGEGAFKKVYRAYDSVQGVEVAWNAVKVSGMSQQARQRVVQEMKILQKLDHPSIIHFYSSFLQKETESVVFITEMMASGTLKEFIQNRPVRLRIVKRWCRHILHALVYLHSHDPPIIHRDLKCDNIFINGSTGDIRIGDLGLASWKRTGQAKSVLGTPEYMAPEMFNELYDEQVDIYAFGMCVLEMITKETPFMECSTTPQIYKKVIAGIVPACYDRLIDGPAKEFVYKCIKMRSPNERRPSAQTLRDDPFLVKRENAPSDDIDCQELLKPGSTPCGQREMSSSSFSKGEEEEGVGKNCEEDAIGSKNMEAKRAAGDRDDGDKSPSRQEIPKLSLGFQRRTSVDAASNSSSNSNSSSSFSEPQLTNGTQSEGKHGEEMGFPSMHGHGSRGNPVSPHNQQQTHEVYAPTQDVLENDAHVEVDRDDSQQGEDVDAPVASSGKKIRVTFGTGSPVEARFGNGDEWFPGKIHGINDDSTFDIKYKDHDFEANVPADLIRIASEDGRLVNMGDILRESGTPEAVLKQRPESPPPLEFKKPLTPPPQPSSPMPSQQKQLSRPASPQRPPSPALRTADPLLRSSAASAFVPFTNKTGTFWRVVATNPLDHDHTDQLEIIFTLKDCGTRTKQTARFPFHIVNDTPEGLVEELVAEMKVEDSEKINLIEKFREIAVEYGKYREMKDADPNSVSQVFRIQAEQKGFPSQALGRNFSQQSAASAPASGTMYARGMFGAGGPSQTSADDADLAKYDKMIFDKEAEFFKFQEEHKQRMDEIFRARQAAAASQKMRENGSMYYHRNGFHHPPLHEHQAVNLTRMSSGESCNSKEGDAGDEVPNDDQSEVTKQKRRLIAEKRQREKKEQMRQRMAMEALEAEKKLFNVVDNTPLVATNSGHVKAKHGTSLKEQMRKQNFSGLSQTPPETSFSGPGPPGPGAAIPPTTQHVNTGQPLSGISSGLVQAHQPTPPEESENSK